MSLNLSPRQPVLYHGSLTAYHGPAVFLGVCEPCGECTDLLDDWAEMGGVDVFHAAPMRYRLEFAGGPNDGQQVDHVRPESFTAIVPDSAALAGNPYSPVESPRAYDLYEDARALGPNACLTCVESFPTPADLSAHLVSVHSTPATA